MPVLVEDGPQEVPLVVVVGGADGDGGELDLLDRVVKGVNGGEDRVLQPVCDGAMHEDPANDEGGHDNDEPDDPLGKVAPRRAHVGEPVDAAVPQVVLLINKLSK